MLKKLNLSFVGKKDAWTCDIAGDFRQKIPSALSFSEDGSVLAIAFQDTVTLWNPTTSSLNTTLTHLLVNEPIKYSFSIFYFFILD